jgi:putative ABC transport system substrate-binding protein
MMRRRQFITLLGGAAAWPVVARAQQAADRVRRVALLSVGADDVGAQTSGFRDALAKLGWVEGRNLHIDLRFGGDSDADIRRHAAELVNLVPDVIVTRGGAPTRVMKEFTQTVPIVMAGAGDPIAAGLIKDTAHPEGNITGVTNRFTSVTGKLVELLKEAAPDVRRVAVLHPDFSAAVFVASIDEAIPCRRLPSLRSRKRLWTWVGPTAATCGWTFATSMTSIEYERSRRSWSACNPTSSWQPRLWRPQPFSGRRGRSQSFLLT